MVSRYAVSEPFRTVQGMMLQSLLNGSETVQGMLLAIPPERLRAS